MTLKVYLALMFNLLLINTTALYGALKNVSNFYSIPKQSKYAPTNYLLRVQQMPDDLTITFTFNRVIQPKIFSLTKPDRIVIDLPNTSPTLKVSKLSKVKIKLPPIKNIRSGKRENNTLRLVLELYQPLGFTIKSLASQNKLPNKHLYSFKLLFISKKTTRALRLNSTHPHHNSCRDFLIVLDPGHGGKDPGAMGVKHTAEKNLTLIIARKLKKLIDQQPGMHAVLTRTGDYYIGLRKRLKIARHHKADVLLSLHADAFINHYSHGSSVFALSQSGATSEAAHWLAEKENYSELGGVNLKELTDQSKVIRTVLIDLSQTATISASLRLGEHMLHYLGKISNLHSNKVEQARFMILKSPDLVSILIEMGFISNHSEEKKLLNTRSQNYLALAILRGLKQYFATTPPTHLTNCVRS